MNRRVERELVNRVVPVVAVLLLGLAGLSACGSDDEALSATEPGTRFEVSPGERFSIVVESNPSTGYGWALAEPLDRPVLRLVGDDYHPPETDLVGAAGHQELTFEAVGDGSTFVQLWYVRSFDDPPEPAERAQFEVIVGSGVPSAVDDSGGDEAQPPVPDDESAITVADLLATGPAGEVVVRGLLFDDGDGLVLCDVLAESFPPQCPGPSVAVVNPERFELSLSSASGVRWSDRPVTVLGIVVGGGLEVVEYRVG